MRESLVRSVSVPPESAPSRARGFGSALDTCRTCDVLEPDCGRPAPEPDIQPHAAAGSDANKGGDWGVASSIPVRKAASGATEAQLVGTHDGFTMGSVASIPRTSTGYTTLRDAAASAARFRKSSS